MVLLYGDDFFPWLLLGMIAGFSQRYCVSLSFLWNYIPCYMHRCTEANALRYWVSLIQNARIILTLIIKYTVFWLTARIIKRMQAVGNFRTHTKLSEGFILSLVMTSPGVKIAAWHKWVRCVQVLYTCWLLLFRFPI